MNFQDERTTNELSSVPEKRDENETLTKNRYPCHVYQRSGDDKSVSIELWHIKKYGSEVYLDNGEILHDNYMDFLADNGKRDLGRCPVCGALMIVQQQFCGGTFVMDGSFYLYDIIPVQSEEEADLLNILLDGDEFCEYPVRHIRARDFYKWWVGEGEPRPNDPEELKEKIRNKYHVTIEEKPVVTTGTDGTETESGRKEYILTRIPSAPEDGRTKPNQTAKKAKKGRPNLHGAERQGTKERMMRYIRYKGNEGARIREIFAMFPEYSQSQIQRLVKDLSDEKQIYLKGKAGSCRWVAISKKNNG